MSLKLISLGAAALLLAASTEAKAQSCYEQPVDVSVSPGQTTPPSAFVTLCSTSNYPNLCGNQPWGGGTTVRAAGVTNLAIQYYAVAGGYFWSPLQGNVTCTNDPLPPGCLSCSGGASITLWATSGAVDGILTVVPSPSSLAGFGVFLKPKEGGAIVSAQTDAAGRFEFRATTEPARGNNWGVAVTTPNPTASGPVSSEYDIGVVDVLDSVTVTSSTLSNKNLTLKNPQCEDPEMRCYKRTPKPVNMVTGNMYFDQTDASLPGVVGLGFVRSYNSFNAYRNRGSAFGRGWTHSYSSTVAPFESTSLVFRGDDGVPMYYEDKNADGTYEAVLPATERSRIVRSASGYVRELKDGSSETYDSSGRLASLSDPTGNVVVLSRGAGGRLTAIADPGGRTLTLQYDSLSRIQSLTGPDGLLATYEYDASGFLRKVSYPDGSGYTFVMDDSNFILSVEDLSGRSIERHTYDGYGRAITEELADGREKLTLSYDAVAQKTTVTDALGRVTTHSWKFVAGLRAVHRTEGPCPSCGGSQGNLEDWIYDSIGRVASFKDGTGAETQYTYDSDGNLASETDPLGRTTTYTYDTRGRVLTSTSPEGSTRTYTYAPSGPLTITESLTATTTRTTTLTYDGRGKPATIDDPRGKRTTLAYSSQGDLLSVTDPLQHATTFVYDARGRRTTVTDALQHKTTTAYDARGRVVRVTSHDGTFSEFAYDAGGRRTSVKDPQGHETRYVYDVFGRLEVVLDAIGGETRYGYDLMSNLVSLTDAKGQTTSFVYDEQNRVKNVVYPGGAEEAFTYDVAGRLTTKTDRKGVVTSYEYFLDGRLKQKNYSDGSPPVTYTYDGDGRIKTAANGTDTLTWSYDLAGQLLSEQSTRNAATIGYAYDSGGSRLSVSLNGSVFVTYDYDDAARLTSIHRGITAFGFSYDPVNRRTSMTYPNGITTSYNYDTLNRLTNLAANLGGTPVTSFTYAYDNGGNRTKKQQLDYTEDYSYDPLSRLTGVERTGGVSGHWHYGYDPVGNRTSSQLDNAVTTAAFNEKNQLLSAAGGGPLRVRGVLDEGGMVKVNGQPASMLAGNTFEATIAATPGTNTFTVAATDASGNVTAKNFQVDVSGSGATYTYDANGNPATKVDGADTWTYFWNAENQLVRVEKNETEVTRYAYDPIGRRVEKLAGGATTAYAYDREDIVREVRGITTFKYVHGAGIDEPLASEDASGALTYLQADGLGSVSKATTSGGAVASKVRYDAWGNVETGTPMPYAFTGREWDPETTLYYFRARYYDPKIGRFISEDPIGFKGGINFYAYVKDNPVNRVDPRGLWAAGFGGGFGAALVPPLPFLGAMGNAGCLVVVDGHDNIGLLCCAGGGPALGGAVEVGEQAMGTFCPTCKTICDLEDWYVGPTFGAAKGPYGFMASGGGYMNATGGGVSAAFGPAQGFGAFGGVEYGGCKLLWQKKKCAGCP